MKRKKKQVRGFIPTVVLPWFVQLGVTVLSGVSSVLSIFNFFKKKKTK